jgi:hypothetical protein
MKDWQRIRLARTDITDYVIHFTKYRFSQSAKWQDRQGSASERHVFKEILDDGIIRPTFAPIRSKVAGTTSNTVRGPDPAVCLTEQPLSAVLVTRKCASSRYSAFGIAYHKYALFQMGGRPVIYGPDAILGNRIEKHDPDYEQGKEIYAGGLPKDLQYLFVRYKPTIGDGYPIDFTWEREWRIKCHDGLPVYLQNWEAGYTAETPVCALVVQKDEDAAKVRKYLEARAVEGVARAGKLKRIVSLETAARMPMSEINWQRVSSSKRKPSTPLESSPLST